MNDEMMRWQERMMNEDTLMIMGESKCTLQSPTIATIPNVATSTSLTGPITYW